MYATNRQAEAEVIVGILHEMTDRMDYEEGLCLLCMSMEDNGHEESCPFRLSDEFVAKYGTHPPQDPKPTVYLTCKEPEQI